ncbi:hypothetical protein C0992_004186 [Termitomyces sp. T32_za158]|nr:hypothetical protein C0992_004186 [Termitomyces sp. T32_za158]
MSGLYACLGKFKGYSAANGGLPPGQLLPLDPLTLPFARTLYPLTATNQDELGPKENEIVASIGKLNLRTGAEVDPCTDFEGDWCKGRTRDEREGWFSRVFVEVLERPRKPDEPKKVD